MFGINGGEFIVLAILAVIILGPERLPEYAAKLAHGIRKARVMAEGAKTQLKDQLGPEYADINWRQYDPRQYDPRRIVREALTEPLQDMTRPFTDAVNEVTQAPTSADGESAVGAGTAGVEPAAIPAAVAAPALPAGRAFTPFDPDAT